jgi:hypothetical protein
VAARAGAEPPPGLLHKIAERETESALAMQNYTYRQSFTVEELDDRGSLTGAYREARDITFSPTHVRYEQLDGKPRNTLTRLRLTPVDFDDLRNIQPFLLTTDKISLYEGKYKGEETVDGMPCFVEYVRPRQMLAGQRYFEGLVWARESDLTVLKSEGQAVPQIETLREQNLTPHFTTFRKIVDGHWSFPLQTYADDTLFFREHPQRIRVEIRYLKYQRFGAESNVTFGAEEAPPKPAPPQ